LPRHVDKPALGVPIGEPSMVGVPLLCPKCQAQVQHEWPFCSHCGSRLGGTNPPQPVIPVCENCNAPVDTSGAFCWKCGVPLTTGRSPFIPDGSVEFEPEGPKAETLTEQARIAGPSGRAPHFTDASRHVSRASVGDLNTPNRVSWWRRPLISRTMDPRLSYAVGITIGVVFALFICGVSPLGAALSELYLSQLNGYPLWGFDAVEAGLFLGAAVGVAWVVTGLLLWRDRSKYKRTNSVANPPTGVA
jgi:hypothetical protein